MDITQLHICYIDTSETLNWQIELRRIDDTSEIGGIFQKIDSTSSVGKLENKP